MLRQVLFAFVASKIRKTVLKISFLVLLLGSLNPGILPQSLHRTRSASTDQMPALATEGASRYVGGPNFQPRAIAVDGDGNIYVVGDEDNDVALYKLNPQLEQVFGMSLGGIVLLDSARAIALDSTGNVYLAGFTFSSDFPVADPLQSELAGGRLNQTTDIFLTKLDPQGNLLFSTYFGGSGFEYADVLAVDDSGNAYIGGLTGSMDFPFTPNAYRTDVYPVNQDSLNSVTTKFVVKIATNPASLVFATSLEGEGSQGFYSIAPVSSGDVYLLEAPDLAGDPASQSLGRLSADGSEFVPAIFPQGDPTSFTTMQTDLDGNLVLAGGSGFVTWDASANQQIARVIEPVGHLQGLAIDSAGNAIVPLDSSAGHSATVGGFPSGQNFLTQYKELGPEVLFATNMPSGAGDVGVAVGPNGEIYTLGSSGLISRIIPGNGDATLPKIMGIANAAASDISANVAPGEIVSLYGPKIGSAEAATTQLDQDGRVTTSLAGVEVRFNGTPGSLLYTGPLQINAVAPFELGSGDSVLVEVMHDGEVWSSATLHPVDAELGVFPYPGTPGAAALNQNGSINSSTNRADPGSIVTVFLTGAGQMTGAAYQDGEVFDPATPLADLPAPKLSAEVAYQGPGLEVLYYGQAPAALAGVIQLNFRLPSAPPEHENIPETIAITVGGLGSNWNVYSTDSFGIWVSGAAGQ